MNPQINIAEYSPVPVAEYLAKAWNGVGLDEVPIETNLMNLYRNGYSNQVFLIQNMQDGLHRDRHMAPFVRALPSTGGLHLLLGDWGKGHVPPPFSVVESVLQSAVNSNSDWQKFARECIAESAPARNFPINWLKNRKV